MDDQAVDIAAIVRQAAGGDRSAFARLIDLHERTALGVAYAVVGCAATAADVTQDAFLKAWQRLGELDDPARFAAWLGRIVRNLAVDALRRRPRGEISADAERLAEVPDDAAADAQHERLERDERRRQVSMALAELDEVSRMVVTLRYFQNLSSRQIAEVVGLSPAAVDMRLSRARSQLRAVLCEHESTAEAPPPPPGMVDTLACAGGGAA